MPSQHAAMSEEDESLLNDIGCWLLVFAHPGHELRAYHLMERVRPRVVVLTDGSGSTTASRLGDSRALIAHAGGSESAIFGPLTDREAYAALMAVDAEPFLEQVDALTDSLLAHDVRALVVDAAEGYNPVHDVCHWIGQAAALRARRSGARIALFELDLIAHPDAPGDGLRLQLDDLAFGRKLAAVSRYEALKAEADAAFARYGSDAFRVEFLRDVTADGVRPPTWVPYYEEVGDARVREGRYASTLRYGSHVRPVITRLLESARSAHHATDLGTLHQ
jgi:hypothetical protein